MAEDDTEDLDAQIAALQAKKALKEAKQEALRKIEEKKARQILVGSTPTKERTIRNDVTFSPPPKKPVFTMPPKSAKSAKQVLPSIPAEAGPSGFSKSLAGMRKPDTHGSRSSARNTLENTIQYGSEELDIKSPGGKGKRRAVERNEDDLTIKHDLRLGPKEHGLDPEGEKEWLFNEPNAGIRLSKRIMAHSAVQDFLYGRYYLTPTLLYSVIRLSRDGATYDLPVDGDWVTIAVVAERGEVRISGTKSTSRDDEDEDDGDEDEEGNQVPKDPKKNGWKGKKAKPEYRKRPPRKYINLKLCSLPPRSRNSNGSSTSTSGDALLQLLLFEADSVATEMVENEDGEKVPVKRYLGGSGGAYERWCNLTVGSVIAVMNPKILRPLKKLADYKAGSQAPHPLALPLAINPTSGDNIVSIGQAKDLGRCSAIQKDGNRCRTWVDLRENAVCEYHVHIAVQKGRSGRAEFTASTSSFALSSRPTPTGCGRSQGYDPKKKTGLLPANGAGPAPRGPDNGGGGATYVIGGSILNTRTEGGLRHHGDEHLGEKIGRRGAEKRKRKDEDREAEEALKRLLTRDGAAQSTGGKYLAQLGVEVGKGKKKGEEEEVTKRAFSAKHIKDIGFDPTLGAGQRRSGDKAKRAEAIESLRRPEQVARLNKPAGLGFSSVKAPVVPPAAAKQPISTILTPVEPKVDDDEAMIDLD